MLNLIATHLNALLADRKGISSMEYAIMAVAIIGAVATAAGLLGTEIGAVMNTLISDLTNAAKS
jgi:Flp pilus assembly pilin Flp